MKITHCFRYALGLLAVASTLHAEPQGGSILERDFLVGESDNPNWLCGMFAHQRDREVSIDDFPGELETTKVAAYIGHTILPWMTVYGIGGQMDGHFAPGLTSEDSSSFLWGGAANFDLFAHEIQDPFLMENQVRVLGNVSFLSSQVETQGDTQNFQELEASVTAALVNDISGHPTYLPESIALFLGPAYSQLLGDDIDDGDEETIGLTYGIQVFHTKRVSYYLRGEQFERSGFAGGFNIRF